MTIMDFACARSAAAQNRVDDDLLRLVLEGQSWTARAKGVERLAALYCAGTLGPAARRAAEDAFRALRFDAEVLVRRVLAECLKTAPRLPRDIAFRLATDKPEVAAPFLEHSPSLPEWDLLAVAREHPGRHRLAIARRRPLTPALPGAPRRCGDLDLTLAVLDNDTARIGEATLAYLLEQPSGATLQAAIARRQLMPIQIGGRLVALADRARQRGSEGVDGEEPRGRAAAV